MLTQQVKEIYKVEHVSPTVRKIERKNSQILLRENHYLFLRDGKMARILTQRKLETSLQE